MRQLTSLLRGLGAAGAAANARNELDRCHTNRLQAEIVVRRIDRSFRHAPAGPAIAWQETPARVA